MFGIQRDPLNVRYGLVLAVVSIMTWALGYEPALAQPRSHIEVRGVYGGSPVDSSGQGSLSEYGVNAVFLHSGSITPELVKAVKSQGGRIFAEFNTMHYAKFLEEHPEAAPIGPDGKVSPPPSGWQGVCPSHPGYRRNRMDEFKRLLTDYDIDGIWLDYHHSHASWEQAVPELPDTCFCARCLEQFSGETGIALPPDSIPEAAELLLGQHRDVWTHWRNALFTDWVREFRSIIDSVKPGALLGTYHCPWSDADFDGARLTKLAIDLRSQARYVDVFSPMPYHARFGHVNDPEWISRQVAWLGEYLGLTGDASEDVKIWPILQVSDWGEDVQVEQIPVVLEHATRLPATGVMVFAWGSFSKQPGKAEALGKFYRQISSAE